MKKRIAKRHSRNNAKARAQKYVELVETAHDPAHRLLLIQQLIPLGLLVVEEELQAEVTRLAGVPYSRQGENQRWGSNPGSVFLGDQKVSIRVPRVRNHKEELELATYRSLQNPQVLSELALSRVLNGLSTRKYERAVTAVPETFGISASSISRQFVAASSQKLKDFLERDLHPFEIVAVIMDGKTFAEESIITALGVTLQGQKLILGFVEAATENASVCRDFLLSLQERGLRARDGILFVVDGAKGLSAAIREVFGKQAWIQRCQWHKRENVVAYLPKSQQSLFRKKLQRAYQQPTYAQAKRRLLTLHKELRLLNQSAANSLLEGLEETLTLHRLGLFEQLGTSFKTTNCIESLHSQVELYTGRVTYWKNSHQRQRWVACAFMEIEKRLRRVKGYRHLKALRKVFKNKVQLQVLAIA